MDKTTVCEKTKLNLIKLNLIITSNDPLLAIQSFARTLIHNVILFY